MKRALLIGLAVAAAGAYAQIAIVPGAADASNAALRIYGSVAAATLALGPFDALVDMVGSAPGTQLTPTIMNAGTLSQLSSVANWSLTGTANTLNVGAAQAGCTLPGNLTVNSTTYTTPHTSQSFAVTHTPVGGLNYATLVLTPTRGINYLTVTGCITLGMQNIRPSGDDFDLVRADGEAGFLAVVQLNNGNCGGEFGVRIHDPTHFSPCVTIPGGSGSTIFYRLIVDENTGNKQMDIWQSGVFLGTQSFTGDIGSSIITASIGNYESGAGGGTSFFQNTLISTTNTGTYSPIASYPLTIQHVQSNSNINSSAGTTVAVTPGAATNAGDCLWALALWQSPSLTGSVSDSVNGAWTAVDSPLTTLTNYRMQTFYKCGITAGTPVITLTVSGSVALKTIAFHEVKGVTTLDQHPTTSNTGTTGTAVSSGTTGTTTAANEYLTGGCATANTPTESGVNWEGSKEFNAASFSGLMAMERVVSATGTYQITGTQSSSGGWSCLINTFK